MPAAELARNARKGGVAAIAEQERRRAAEDAATPAPLWIQARRDEIQRINDANEYDIGSIENYDPDR
jgi:hypothetical protein